MTNNDILKKLRVALHLRNDEIIEILKLTDFEISATELGAFFRTEDHRNYRPCGDQVLRHFLDGLIIHMRGKRAEDNAASEEATGGAGPAQADPAASSGRPAPAGPAAAGGAGQAGVSAKAGDAGQAGASRKAGGAGQAGGAVRAGGAGQTGASAKAGTPTPGGRGPKPIR